MNVGFLVLKCIRVQKQWCSFGLKEREHAWHVRHFDVFSGELKFSALNKESPGDGGEHSCAAVPPQFCHVLLGDVVDNERVHEDEKVEESANGKFECRGEFLVAEEQHGLEADADGAGGQGEDLHAFDHGGNGPSVHHITLVTQFFGSAALRCAEASREETRVTVTAQKTPVQQDVDCGLGWNPCRTIQRMVAV